MNADGLHGMWQYFLMLESDLDDTFRYIDPVGQEDVHSFEFAKILVLACTEVESVFKALCCEITVQNSADNITKYKDIILNRFPKMTEAKVQIKRLGRIVRPFENWETQSPKWWKAYQGVKHDRGKNFTDATYQNASMALAALYILIFYLAKLTKIEFHDYVSKCFESDYESTLPLFGPQCQLPDFEEKLGQGVD